MRNIALRLAYDGTDFVGSQLQQLGRSVQGELEGAWEQLTQERARCTLAGRTDAGVHAYGQVANIRSRTKHTTATIARGLNAILPDDVAVLGAEEVSADFHARYSAIRRSYRYLIDPAFVALPTLRNLVLHYAQPLDLERMNAALATLVGQHDFAAFAAATPERKSTVRVVFTAQATTVELFGRELVAINVVANAFLHHMVRVIVGTALLVGQGRMSVAAFEEVRKGRERRAAGKTAPAHALTLVEVSYPTDQLVWKR